MCKKIILSIFLGLAALTASAQEAINLEDYRYKVIEYSQELKQSKEGVYSAQSQVKAIKTGFLPKLVMVADGNYQLNTVKFDLGGGSTSIKPWGYSVGATIAQNIYSGNSVRNQYDAAKISEMIARDAEMLTIDNIIYVAEIHYWSLAANIAMLEAANENIKLIENLYVIVKDRFDEGLISKNDLLMVETRKMEAEFQKSNADRKYTTSLINFNILMGVNDDTNVTLIDVIDKSVPIPVEFGIDDVLNSRPEYQIAEKQIELNKKRLAASLSQFRPQITAGITGSYGSKAINFDGSSMVNGIVFGQVSIPIFEWNKKKHIKAIGNSTINSSMYEQTIVKDKISGELYTAWVNITQSASELQLAESTLKIAQQSLDLNTLSYNEGRLTILDVLTSQLSWLMSYNNVISTNLQMKGSLSQYNKVTGTNDDITDRLK